MFTSIDPTFSVAGQLAPADMAVAAAEGFTTVVNNRPDGEQAGQPTGADIAAAAAAAGLAYHAIPVDHQGLRTTQVAALRAVLESAPGPVLAFCRSGTRSTLLWALTRSTMGDDAATLSAKAEAAGYDLSPIRSALM